MNSDRVREVLDKYAHILRQMGAEPVREPHMENLIDYHSAATKNHLLWMCGETKLILEQGRTEKAMRWLGFLQGAFWGLRLRTLEEMKRDNAPPDAVFDAERV